MKRVAFLFLAVFSCGLIWAQNSITGRVVNEDNEPMAGVNVVVKGSYLGTVTNANGDYQLTNVQSGQRSFTFSFIGYEKNIQTITVDGNEVLNVTMEPSSVLTSEIVVSAVRAVQGTPIAYSEVTEEELEKNNFGQDLPYLINMTPSVVTTSDAGAGIGYSGMRIRGTDITRINVTVNGIPLNDSESQGVFWVNMPDFSASVDNVQIQRGVGTSTNGAASFGASVNLSTLNVESKPSVFVDNSFGSFNSWKNSVNVSTGLLSNNMAFDVRLSRIASDGFIDRSAADLKSFYFSGGYYGEKSTFKFVTFSGDQTTHQAWNGVPKVRLENDQEGMEYLVMMDGWSKEEADNLYTSDARTFNRYLYPDQTDNYQQDHYQLHFNHVFNEEFNVNAAVHYTRGKGYYESYKYDKKMKKYGLPYDSVIIAGETIKKTDMVQQKWLDNHFYGVTFSGNYQKGNTHLLVGGSLNKYECDHYGDITWMAYNNGVDKDFRWYTNRGEKTEFNSFAKATIDVAEGLSVFGDLQFRHVGYDMEGLHDDFTDLTQNHQFDFVNPKFGINWDLHPGHRAYFSYAMANREPSRSDYRDADPGKRPHAEQLSDFEAGYELRKNKYAINVNAFYMLYNDQLVMTGKINSVGAPVMINVPESYRAGVELMGGFHLMPGLNWTANVTLSTNKINDFTEYVDNWNFDEDHPENGPKQYEKNLGTTDIAFSPNVVIGSSLNWEPVDRFSVMLKSKYVGDQFIDNTSSEERKLDAWFVNDVMMNYNFNVPQIGEFNFGVQVNNLFNEEYESNAWVYRYCYDGAYNVLDGYFPQAGTNFMVRLGMKF
ncbi:TonB-dependent receptor [Marinilabiliaceae bacterium JC017]|nr:TonB-dependent receptor [Marinilabiliaceae bacterium JC017]